MSSLKILDRGYKRLVQALTGKQKTGITVGVHAADGAETYPRSGKTVADVATINEFGAPGVPQRSFIRAWFDENSAKNREAVKRMAQSVLKGKRTRKDAVELLAQAFVGQIQRRMAQGIPPPNSPITIALKGSSKPLIDTGQLRSSITYAIDGEVRPSKAAIKRKAANKRAREKKIKALKKEARQLFRQAKRQIQRAAKQAPKKAARTTRKVVKTAKRTGKQATRVTTKIAKKVARTFRRKRRRRNT